MSAFRNREEGIFDAVVQLPTPEQRAAYLNEACASQPELRRRVEELLAAHEAAGGFLESLGAITPEP